MIDQIIHCRFALGGITGQIAAMHEEGLIDRILDVQSFDLDAAKSLKNNHIPHQISASYYARHKVAAAVAQLARDEMHGSNTPATWWPPPWTSWTS